MKEKYISEAALKDEPKKKISLKIKEGSITPEHLSQRVVDEIITPMIEDSVEEYKEIAETIATSGMTPEDKTKLNALPTAEELEERLGKIFIVNVEGPTNREFIADKTYQETFTALTENKTVAFNTTYGVFFADADASSPVIFASKYYAHDGVDVVSRAMLLTYTAASGIRIESADLQKALTFDATPTQGSNNPVSSKGVYQAIQDIDVTDQISGKADKSEMSIVAGTGVNADKTTITLKSGTSATVLTKHQDVSEFIKEGEVFGTGDDSTASFNPYSDTVWSKAQNLSESQKQQIRENIGAGAADNEDIQNVNGELKFADKAYNTSSHSGLGRKYLRKNIVDNKNVLTQSMVNTTNTIYHIQYDYDLNGETITIPAGCVLEFDGGSLKNGTLVGDRTNIFAIPVQIFSNITINGGFDSDFLAEWFLPVYDSTRDYTSLLTALFNCGADRILFANPAVYKVTDTIVISNDVEIISAVKWQGIHDNEIGPGIVCNTNKTALKYIHTDASRKIRLCDFFVRSGDKDNPDFTTPIVLVEVQASCWNGAEINLGIFSNHSTITYGEESWQRVTMVGLEIHVVSGSFTLSKIGGYIMAHKALYIHNDSGFITDIDLNGRIEACYGGEINGSAIYLRGEFQSMTFPTDIPELKVSDCFFFGGHRYVENSHIWDLGAKKGTALAAVQYGTDDSLVALVEGKNKAKIANFPTRSSIDFVNLSNAYFKKASELSLLEIKCSQDGTILFTESDFLNLDGLFNPRPVTTSHIASTLSPFEDGQAYVKPDVFSASAYDSTKPLDVEIKFRFFDSIFMGYWLRVFSNKVLGYLNVVRKVYSDNYSTLVKQEEFNLVEMTEGTSVTSRNGLCFCNWVVDTAREEVTISYSVNNPAWKIWNNNTIRLFGFNIFEFNTNGRVAPYIETNHLSTDFIIQRGSARNIYMPLVGMNCNQGFWFIAPSSLQRTIIHFTCGDSMSTADYLSAIKQPGTIVIKANGDCFSSGLNAQPIIYKSDHAIPGLSYYRIYFPNSYVTLEKIETPQILLDIGVSAASSVGTNQTTMTITRINRRGNSGVRPTLLTGHAGFLYYDTTLSKMILWNGTAWVNVDGSALS